MTQLKIKKDRTQKGDTIKSRGDMSTIYKLYTSTTTQTNQMF